MAHKHSVYDTDKHFSINPITREIKNEASSKIMIMQGDHNSERFTFEVPRYIEGHDMTLCDKIRIHYINISINKENKYADLYEVDDMQLSPESEEVAIFSWLISRNVTKYYGALTFLIEFSCHTDSEIDYEWNTARYSGISVGNGMDNAETVLEMYSDVLIQWEQKIANGGMTEEQEAQLAKNTEDISQLSNEVANLFQNTILPETNFTEESDFGQWDNMEAIFLFNLQKALVEGETYVVTINGTEYTATAEAVTDGYIVENGVNLYKQDCFSIDYEAGGLYYDKNYNTAMYIHDCIVWGDATATMLPATVSIKMNSADEKLNMKYLDMDAIKSALSTVDMVATLEDGTTATYKLYGEAVTE